jgi:hypothetical protein
MDRGFDREFYRTEWRRVLPLGPDGIQPYVRASRISRRPGLQAALGRLIATLGAMARGVIGFDRFAAIGMASGRCRWRPNRARSESVLRSASRTKRRARLRAGHLRPGGSPARLSSPASQRVAQIRQKELKQSRARADIIAKHARIMSLWR